MKTIQSLLIPLTITMLIPAMCMAGGGAGHEPSFADTFKYWPNFLVFLFLFYFLIKSPLINFWASRREAIDEGVSAGVRELAKAQEQLEQAQKKLENLQGEIDGVKSSIAGDAEREAAKIVEEANERAKRIAEQTQSSMEAEKKAAEVALRQELADYVVSKAEERIRNEMSAESDRQLRQATTEDMKSLLN